MPAKKPENEWVTRKRRIDPKLDAGRCLAIISFGQRALAASEKA